LDEEEAIVGEGSKRRAVVKKCDQHDQGQRVGQGWLKVQELLLATREYWGAVRKVGIHSTIKSNFMYGCRFGVEKKRHCT
jgi:hypothetical protein